MEHAEIIITTGGLGPTVDDPTREAVAKAAGVETEFREELWEQVVATISKYGRKPAENQKRQAVVPKGALGVLNPVGTAPSFIVETERTVIISLPGVPNEMEHILHEFNCSLSTKKIQPARSDQSACASHLRDSVKAQWMKRSATSKLLRIQRWDLLRTPASWTFALQQKRKAKWTPTR